MRLVFGEGRWPHRENFTVQDPLAKAKAKAEEYSRYADEHERRAKTVVNPLLRDALLNVATPYRELAEQVVAISKHAPIGRGTLDALNEGE
jgi:hypothetical protein